MKQEELTIIPDQFTVKESFYLNMTMKLKDSHGKKFGTINEKALLEGVGQVFQFHDEHDHVIAVGHKKISPFGSQLQIHDDKGNKIGSIDHQILKQMTSGGHKFTVSDQNGNKVGGTQQFDIHKSVILLEHNGQKIGQITKGGIEILGDKWTCKFQGDLVDRRVLVFIPAFASGIQAEEKQHSNK